MIMTHCTREHILVFLQRMILNLPLEMTWRPGMLYHLDVSDIKLEDHNAERVYRSISLIAASSESKCEKGGLSAVNDRPTSVTIWERFQLDGQLRNINDTEGYIEVSKGIYKTHPKWF